MKELRIFARILDVRKGKELTAQQLADYKAVSSQVGDSLGEWIPVTLASKPEGTRAKRRQVSEIAEDLFIKHPEKDGNQEIEVYYIGTSDDEDEVIRYESISFPAWYENEVFTG
jgi:hypothetical protein